MAGNKNPWRDIFSPAEWTTISAQARAAAARGGMGGHRQAPQAQRWGATPTSLKDPTVVLQQIGALITQYDQIQKDDSSHFLPRAQMLNKIATLCTWYGQGLVKTHVPGAKQATGKVLNDQIDVWVHSLGSRALKKATYLETMADWHQTAKAKYKDRTQLSAFLRGLAGDNTSHGGQKLHATPYATIEKIDPYHRQTFVFLDPDETTANDDAVNPMGEAFVDYLAGSPASTRDSNIDATFYEWLEYHPFCIGTPGVHGDARYKSPPRIKYDGHDLGLVYLPANKPLEYTRIVTDAGARFVLNTSDFRASGKGPKDAAAFIWDGDGNLWLHEHGWDGFIHASAKQGKKIRCSGMLVVKNGLVTCVTNQSGHYAPNAQSIYNFVSWLNQRKVLAPTATILMEHDATFGGNRPYVQFMQLAKANHLLAPSPVPYLI